MRHELEGMRLHKAVQHIQIDKRKVRRYITYVLDSPYKIVYDIDDKTNHQENRYFTTRLNFNRPRGAKENE